MSSLIALADALVPVGAAGGGEVESVAEQVARYRATAETLAKQGQHRAAEEVAAKAAELQAQASRPVARGGGKAVSEAVRSATKTGANPMWQPGMWSAKTTEIATPRTNRELIEHGAKRAAQREVAERVMKEQAARAAKAAPRAAAKAVPKSLLGGLAPMARGAAKGALGVGAGVLAGPAVEIAFPNYTSESEDAMTRLWKEAGGGELAGLGLEQYHRQEDPEKVRRARLLAARTRPPEDMGTVPGIELAAIPRPARQPQMTGEQAFEEFGEGIATASDLGAVSRAMGRRGRPADIQMEPMLVQERTRKQKRRQRRRRQERQRGLEDLMRGAPIDELGF